MLAFKVCYVGVYDVFIITSWGEYYSLAVYYEGLVMVIMTVLVRDRGAAFDPQQLTQVVDGCGLAAVGMTV